MHAIIYFAKLKALFLFLVMGNTNKFCISFALVINGSPLILFLLIISCDLMNMITLTQVNFE